MSSQIKKRKRRVRHRKALKKALRNPMLKLLVFVLVVIVIVTILAVPRRRVFQGVYQSNNVSQDVKIVFTFKSGMRLTEKLNAKIIVKDEMNQVVMEHKWEDWSFIAAKKDQLSFDFITMSYYSSDKDENGFGHMYLDKAKKNMIVITEDFNIYAADNEFRQIVEEFLN